MSAPNDRAYADERLRHLSLAQIEELREQSAKRRKEPRVPMLTAQERDGNLPLSFAQEQLWFLDQLGLVGAAYNMPLALRLHGRLDITALERSFTELIRRHESLRTRFESVGGSPVQIIDPPKACLLDIRDLSTLPQTERALQERVLGREEANRPFNLATGPLLRASLLKVADREHLLLFTLHHIVADGWSLGIVQKELGALYRAYSEGRPLPTLEASVQYADYAIWQRRWLQNEILQSQLHYWTEQLAGAPPQLLLPTDRPRPPVESFRGAKRRFDLPAAVLRALKELAGRERATLFMVLIAAYQVLLSRWSSQRDIVVGSPMAGRTTREMESLVGCFVNTVALRTDVDDEMTFRQLLARVKDVTLEAHAHQDLPFEALVKELRPDRDLGRQPIFQVMLVLQNYPEEQLELSGLTWTWAEVERGITHFDLTLMLYETADGFFGVFEYATDLFDAATIDRMTEHYRTLLNGIVSSPDDKIWRLPLASEAELQRVIREWNATEAVYPHEQLVHELFEIQAHRTADAVAVISDGMALTYAELNSRANQLARFLCAQGMQVGERVPIVMSRSLQMLVAQLAVLKSGGVYVPMDPALPVDRQAFIIRDCGARRVLAQRCARAAIDGESAQWIDCTEVIGEIEKLPGDNLGLSVERPAAAYVMYTSGSTGVPKGVVTPHHAINRLVINNGYAQIGPLDCIAHCSNPAFDASTFEVWAALLHGASILILPHCVAVDPEQLGRALREHRVTVLFQTTALFNQHAAAMPESFPRLRYLIFGGEAADANAVRKVLRDDRCEHLLNAYGPTETTTFATWYPCGAVTENATSIPIGRPISNTQIYILDSHLQPAPIGVTGEIYIGGAGLALGYVNRPELTAERFVADPFSAHPEARLYKSGDLGRWRADGNIDFLGRNDQQVKIRGFRIEPGEIEVQLVRHARIKDAVVLAREDAPGEKRLVAYLIPHSHRAEAHPGPEELRDHLKQMLPEHMTPSAFVMLERFPLTPNGKLDRRALPAPDLGALLIRKYQPPRGAVEELVADIWRQLLCVERVGRHDNFFELGGHSLLAVKLVAQIAERLQVSLGIPAVFRCPTVQQMVELIESLRAAHRSAAAGPGADQAPKNALDEHDINRLRASKGQLVELLQGAAAVEALAPRARHDGANERIPLTYSQLTHWRWYGLGERRHLRQIASATRMAGQLNVSALRDALAAIVRRHEALRTRILVVDDVPMQTICEPSQFELITEALTAVSAADREAQVRRRIDEQITEPIDVTTDHLFTARLLRLQQDEHVLIVAMEHLISDGVSMNILLRDLFTAYSQIVRGLPVSLPPIPIQLADYAVWQRNAETAWLQARVGCWEEHLAGCERVRVPDERGPSVSNGEGWTVSPVVIDEQLKSELRDWCKLRCTTLVMSVFTAYVALVLRWCNVSDAVVRFQVDGRVTPDLENTVGCFPSALNLRARLHDEDSFLDLTKRVVEEYCDAYEHSDFGYIEAQIPRRPFVHNSAFNWLPQAPQDGLADLDGSPDAIRCTPIPFEHPMLKRHARDAEPVLLLFDTGDRVVGDVYFPLNRFSVETMERFARNFLVFVTALLRQPEQRVKEILLAD